MRIAVIGGGVIGLAIAFEAARRGIATTSSDAARMGAASSAAGGMLAPISEAEPALSALVRLGLQSLSSYAEWIESIESIADRSCGFQQNGSLLLALDSDHRAQLERIRRHHEDLGLSSRWLSSEAVASAEPRLARRQLGALLVERECCVDPRRLLEALKIAFENLGGQFSDDPRADVVVDCRGAWAENATMRAVKGHALRLSGEPLIERVVRTPDVYLVPRADGTLYVGATSEEAGFDTRPRAGAVHELLEHARRAMPGVSELELQEVVVGLRPAARDNLPTIGWLGSGRFVASGHYRNGILLAPITACLAVDSIERGSCSDKLGPFDPLRFEERDS